MSYRIVNSNMQRKRCLDVTFEDFTPARLFLLRIPRRKYSDIYLLDGDTGEVLKIRSALLADKNDPYYNFVSYRYKELLKVNPKQHRVRRK